MTQFNYTSIVYAFIFDAFVMHFTISSTDVIGAVLIVGSLVNVGLLGDRGKKG